MWKIVAVSPLSGTLAEQLFQIEGSFQFPLTEVEQVAFGAAWKPGVDGNRLKPSTANKINRMDILNPGIDPTLIQVIGHTLEADHRVIVLHPNTLWHNQRDGRII